MPDIKRYEHFGWDYDHYNPREPRAEAWYLAHLARTGGPVLELACGGGKLLEAFARAGHEATGLDLSPSMLGRAGARISSLPDDVSARITLVEGDMSDFDLGRSFAAVVLADNSFRELSTTDELAACLRCVRRHLFSGGLFLLTETRFDPRRYPDGERVEPWTRPMLRPETGETVRRRVSVRLTEDQRRIEGKMTYEVTARDGTVTVEECPYAGPILTPDEYREMLADAGFSARLFVGYDEKPDDGTEPVLCFVATAP